MSPRAPGRYNLLVPAVWQAAQERQRAFMRLAAGLGWALERVAGLRVVDLGCGTGGGLLELIQLGFSPELLAGVDLDAARLAQARRCLPSSVALHLGDAALYEAADASIDVVQVATLFSSILDDATQARLAGAIWRWLRPGGGVLWYDFTVGNPMNPRVRGVPLARVRALFPAAELRAERVTLAPSLARLLTRVHPSLYPIAGALPLLRTHVLAWLGKPA